MIRTLPHTGIEHERVQALLVRERAEYAQRNPKSQAMSARAAPQLMFGVPLHWMNDWSTPFALHVAQAQGAQLTDVDGHTLADFCLGDTGAMFGHSPAVVTEALATQARHGLTTMLPNEDASVVGELLARHFGLPKWQFAMTASDANRFLLRWVRAATGRRTLLVFNGCYHGTVDDVFVDLVDGQPTQRASLLGQVHDLTTTTRVVEFNDLAALEAALALGDVACVLAEPVMTNIGMVLPEPGYWVQAQDLIRRHGSLLVLDETHTLSSGPGGYARAHGLQPDAVVVGKALGGGMPCAAYGFSAALAERAEAAKRTAPPGHSGIGTTLTANLLAMAAMRATLTHLMTPEVFAPMHALAEQLAAGLRTIIARHGLPWCVTQVGARVEFQFCPQPPRNGSQAEAVMDAELEHALHLALLNRGVLITPFHNMMLVCPDTTGMHVQRLLAAFDTVLASLTAAADS
ncbi:aspartate aminotransferase family protein [Burkholderia cenocepacia]|uniref:aspartate aminotransferase family protein n=1 Tax=Burkholderia cepacia complex TaxID=87882 RepID=UPI000F57030D|nr:MULTISPECIES: aspartate aminotransferase family protein [Burkholderia cepacia complex]ELW9450109.1 aspartate aminotransferase family protein [Burkholderia cenocepacia]MBR8486130.1 aspartate aminotransferase family protein [Burkholderia cenocepacia]MDN7471930.1 aspartate aminotransferase family protein [Burkholderia orbicola]MDN7501607.1 aspartate aminotransferase family protein [Burkholderia orbicola]RQU18349.1 aspartate aminotransferase family protein [Burkholderia cenocepacia]